MPDYIPRTDADFHSWAEQFITYVSGHLAALGLVAGDLTPVTTEQAEWTAAYTDHMTAKAAAQGATQLKDTARAEYEAAIRALVGELQASSSVSDAEKAAMLITVPDTIPTPVGAPTTRPILAADTSQRLRHEVSFTDEAKPNSRAKPAGVRGCEIWLKMGGAAPADLSECTYLATDTKSPYLLEFEGAEAAQTAHYIGRWVSTRGEAGPISETVSATVGG